MPHLQLDVPGISCDHCKHAIEGSVGGLAGVSAVNVAIEARTVDVDFDETAVDVGIITDAIEDAGYDVVTSR